MDEEDTLVIPTGIHGRTGQRFHAPLAVEDLSRVLRDVQNNLSKAETEAAKHASGERYALPFGASPEELSSVGWGVVYAPNISPAVREALKLLVEKRKSKSGRHFKEIEFVLGETPGEFLKRFNVAWGSVQPHRLPYHLLIVGSPEDIPFEFQYQLDIEYSVGRLYFDGDSAEPYATYVKHVLDYESAAIAPRPREVGFFAPVHGGDTPTKMAFRHFIQPLSGPQEREEDASPHVLELVQATAKVVTGADASRETLKQWLGGGASQPAVIWTAGHGMAFDATDPEQMALQGALLTGDWTGFNTMNRAHYLAGSDLDAESDLRGMVAFLFACFGAGTPKIDSYPNVSGERREIAQRSFIAALPQAMMMRGALGVIGHIDVAYGYSFKPRGVKSAQVGPYSNCLGHLLSSKCLGTATCDLSGRAATLGAQVADTLFSNKTPMTPSETVNMWCERNDARGYVLLGDPAIRLRFPENS